MYFGAIAYVTDARAKTPPARSWASRFVGRVFIGALYGFIPAAGFLCCATAVCVSLDVYFHLWNPSGDGSLSYLAEFAMLAGIAGSFGAAWTAALATAPDDEARLHFKRIVWCAMIGIIAAIWLGTGVGLLAHKIARLVHFNLFPEVILWLATLSGLASGIVATKTLRAWRAPR
jgi:hypothetical protein